LLSERKIRRVERSPWRGRSEKNRGGSKRERSKESKSANRSRLGRKV